MACSPTRPLLLLLALSVAGCSDDGVPGGTGDNEVTGAGSTGGADSASATSPGGSSGSSDSDSGSDTDGNQTTGIDPTGMSTGGSGSTSAGDDGGSTCVARCMEDDDCLSNGVDAGFTCSENGFCHPACEDAADCVPLFSGWVGQPCDDNDACATGPCIDYGGDTGGCAVAPIDGFECETQMLAEVDATDVEGNAVTVCAETTGLCTLDPLGDMSCVLGCENFGCTEPLTCEADGYCHCASNDDCIAAGTGDTCSETGFCFFGCEDVAECEATFGEPPLDGQTLSCE